MDFQGRKTLSVREMGRWLGIKKVESYWLVHKNFFDVVQVAGRMRVVMESFEYWYAGQVKYKKITGEPPGERLKLESYSPQDIAQILGISEYVAYSLIDRYNIPTITVDYWKRVRKEDFDNWYASQTKYRNAEDRQRDADTEENSMTMPEMARLLDVTRHCVYGILKSKKGKKYLKVIVLADRKRITKDSFEAWYRAQKDFVKPEDREGNPNVKKRKTYAEGLKSKNLTEGTKTKPGCKEKHKKAAQKKRPPRPIRSTNLEYLTVQEAADMAQVPQKKVFYWVSRNKFPAIRSSSVIRINKTEFENFLKERKGDI